MSVLASSEADYAWELRAAWASRREVVVVMDTDRTVIPRLRGTIEHVAPTDAFALLVESEGAQPWHVPCALILAIRRPHFHEPLHAPVQLEMDVEPFPGQMPLFDIG